MNDKTSSRLRRGLLTIPLLIGTLLTGAVLTGCAHTSTADPQLVDAVIQKLQDSGKLDQAVETSLKHLVQKRQQAQAEARQKRLQQLEAEASKMPAPDLDQEHVLGSRNATVSMIEYSDFECPFCKRFHETPQQVLEQFDGQVNLVYRSMPLAFHGKAAVLEARAGECAARLGGNDVFWNYSNDLFKHSQSNGKGLGDGQTIYTLASKYDLNKNTFKACLDDPAIQKIIDHHLKTAQSMGITGTPTTIVRNNQTGETRVVVGARPADQLKAAIEEVLSADDGTQHDS